MNIHPSILSADFANLADELGTISDADAVHVDVMDNHFVPNLTFGLPVVSRLQEISTLPLDVHLMITDPELWAPKYAEVGCASVTFHLEASREPVELARRIRQIGSSVAVAIKPGTPISKIEHLLPEIDMLLVMTVEPGFGGQALIPETIEKISQAKALASGLNLEISIQVDGGVTESNIELLAEAGANVFVAGSAVFRSTDRNLEIARLRQLAQSHKH